MIVNLRTIIKYSIYISTVLAVIIAIFSISLSEIVKFYQLIITLYYMYFQYFRLFSGLLFAAEFEIEKVIKNFNLLGSL